MSPADPDRSDLVKILYGLLPHLYNDNVSIRHPADLLSYKEARPLLDLLSPPSPGSSEHDRARAAHKMIHAAIRIIGPPKGDAAAILLDLVPTTRGIPPLAVRRDAAAPLFNIKGPWFARTREDTITMTLAMELEQRIHASNESTTRADPTRQRRSMAPPPPASSFRPRTRPETP